MDLENERHTEFIKAMARNDSDYLSEHRLAELFSTKYINEIRWVEAWQRWYVWNGNYWAKDETLEVKDKIRSLIVEYSDVISSIRTRNRLQTYHSISAIEKILRSDRRHAATTCQWDTNPWKLNTPEGIVDLYTGQLHPPDPNEYMTKLTAVSPGNDCPTWFNFLTRITGGNIELEAFLNRIAGYSLVGSVLEHAFFFFYGSGRNGKSTFVDTLLYILGNYACISPMTTFMTSRSSEHPTELARLQGARLTVSQETEAGKRWMESRIKAITGGDPITARFMRQDYFTFTPQFKLIITGNQKPSLKSVDEAMRRRLHLVPFNITITHEEQDMNLPHKLIKEAPGIFSWMIQGCLNWQQEGLSSPDIVQEASKEYFEEEDIIKQWINECCEIGIDKMETSGKLFESYSSWLNRSGEYKMSHKLFSRSLMNHGFIRSKDSQGRRIFKGLCLKEGYLE